MKPNAKSLGKFLEPGKGEWVSMNSGPANVQATLTSAIPATALVEFSNDRIGGVPAIQIVLDSATKSDGIVLDPNCSWQFARATAVAVSGGEVYVSASAKGE